MRRGKTHQQWEERLAELEVYKKRFGHCDVPARWQENRPLAYWVDNQRCFRRKRKLQRIRIARLNRLGFSWSTRLKEDAVPGSFRNLVRAWDYLWDSMFAALCKYKQKHGSCAVAREDGMNGQLYKWVRRCRGERRKGSLREDRRWRLEKIGFWSTPNQHQLSWEKKFGELVEYKKRHGHCDVPCHGGPNPVLGNWVSTQRSFRNKGLLTRERIDRLNSIGFRWLARLGLDSLPGIFREQARAADQLWDAIFKELELFKKQHGHCRVPSTDPALQGLFRWVGRQREQAKAGSLTSTRRARLDALDFPWKATNPSWEIKFAELVAYKKRFSHCLVPARWPGNRSLGLWVHNQRAFKRRGTLTNERISKLNNIGFV